MLGFLIKDTESNDVLRLNKVWSALTILSVCSWVLFAMILLFVLHHGLASFCTISQWWLVTWSNTVPTHICAVISLARTLIAFLDRGGALYGTNILMVVCTVISLMSLTWHIKTRNSNTSTGKHEVWSYFHTGGWAWSDLIFVLKWGNLTLVIIRYLGW